MSAILIVDDYEPNRYLLRTLLAASGYDVLEAANGAEALELAHRTRPDLIIADILMPQMDGFALCRECKRDTELRDIPFVFYTATYTDPRDEALAMQLGAARFIVKPMENDAFIAILREVLQAHRAGQLAAPQPPLEEETVFYRLYNEALIRKLEDKMLDLQQVNRSLAESEARFRRLAENAQDLIYRYEFAPQRGFTYVNPAATAITGYTPEEHYADPDLGLKLIHPDDRPLLEQYLQGGGTFYEPVVLRWIRKDGQIVWTEQCNVPVFDEAGTLIAIEGIARDVTEQARMKEALERREAELRRYAEGLEQRVQERTAQLYSQYARLEAILNSASDGILVTGSQGQILLTNPIAHAWLTQRLPAEDVERLQATVRDLALRAEERPQAILELTGLDLQLNAAPITEPGLEGAKAIVAFHDVSHLKALDRLKSQFVSEVSHELRTPVTTIKLYTALLRRSPPEMWPRYLDALEQAANQQARLVEDILQVSRIDAGRLEIQPQMVNLNELAGAVVASHQTLAQIKDLALECRLAQSGPTALVDPERMTQALNNLVENAINYTPQGRVKVITGQAEMEQRTWATICVSDTGMGIPEDELPHIFERFYRGEKPRQSGLPGSGLGLAIAKEIVDLHGGRIMVESQEGAGSTFIIWLPLAEE